VRHLREVFKCLVAANLPVRLKKCQFGCVKVHYLNHLTGLGEIEPEEGKVRAVREYPTPVTKRDLRTFLGLVEYYRHFVPHFAEAAVPLSNLTRKKEPDKVVWSQDCETSFRKLKNALLQKPVLVVADPTKVFD